MMKIRKESLLRWLKTTGIRLIFCTALVSSIVVAGWVVPEVKVYTKSIVSHSTDIKTAKEQAQSLWGQINGFFGMMAD